MSAAYLGYFFDIHGGGMDLVFPHHENEIAQSCAACRESNITYWIHNGFVNIDSQKMSKSLGNFFTIRQVYWGEKLCIIYRIDIYLAICPVLFDNFDVSMCCFSSGD